MPRLIVLAIITLSISILSGCTTAQPASEPFAPDRDKSLAPGQLALRKISRDKYPDFSKAYDNRAGLEQAIDRSLNYLSKSSSKKYYPYGDVSHDRAVASLQRMKQLLRESRSGRELDDRIKAEFEVYQSVGYDDKGSVWFTGYYTPIFEGRLRRDNRFRYPLYGLPKDLVKDSEGVTIGRRKPDGTVEPKYYTRKEIDQQRLLDGTEVAFLKDPFEAYVVGVQGSGKLRLEDGSLYGLGYAGTNGHEYQSVPKKMIADGTLNKRDVSLQKLIDWFRENPQYAFTYIWVNPRLAFFKPMSGDPVGCLNEPVTPMRTIATDKAVFPRACIALLEAKLPANMGGKIENAPYSGFVLDQDAGGAIRAAGRCDVYMGTGPDAEALAGRTGSDGTLYYVFVREGGGALAAGR